MHKDTVILDLETQNTFQEIGQNDCELLRVSIVGINIYNEDRYSTFTENEMFLLEQILRRTGLLVGFNIKRFDIPVLQKYLSMDFFKIPVLDIMEEVSRVCSFRTSLNNIAQTTLGKSKLGSGLDAIKYYQQGLWDKLREYCLKDVEITKEVYDYGLAHSEIFFTDKNNKRHRVPVHWK
ncbi:hypothetical protein AC481_05495 [miscellaneous Crenarchaeota group archaeon SMTZ-80]|nr:MAG: hypothetical protein AC481_05495 [miscellaneous Crenarchaeota group archaeon SMTZ-80]